MEVLLVEFRIRPEHVAGFERAIADNARASLADEPGCRLFDVCRSAGDPCVFLLYELDDDEAAVQAHLHAPHFLAMDETTRDWVKSKTVRRLRRTFP